jgi:molecular chaperone GrpE
MASQSAIIKKVRGIMAKKKKEDRSKSEESNNEETLVKKIMVEMSTEEIAVMLESMESVKADAEENKDKWLRAQADFANYKKRIDAQQIKLFEDASARVIKQYLPLLDDMKRALDNQPETGDSSDWVQGIDLIYQKFHVVLGNEGVTTMETKGENFDPNFHEAISQEESPEHKSGQIIEEIQTGYMIGERVLRHALVRVAS